MSFPRAATLCLVALLALTACAEKAEQPDAVKPTAQAPSAKLEPLPEAPKFNVEPEALPGHGDTLSVLVARPTGNVQEDIRPTITFSAPVMALQATSAATKPPANISPSVEGEWKWLGSSSVEFVPTEPFAYATEYTVTVPAGLAALNGERMIEPYSWTFRTPAPSVVEIDPIKGSRWLAPDQAFTITFNQQVRNLAQHARIQVGDKTIAMTQVSEAQVRPEARPYYQSPEQVAAEARRYTYVLKPATALPKDSGITLVIDAALAGTQGPLTLGKDERLSFRTYGAMKFLVATACANDYEGARCPTGPLVLKTSNPIDVESLKTRLHVEPEAQINWDNVYVPEQTQWNVNEPPQVFLQGRFKPGTTYSVKIDAGVVDGFGNKAPAFATEVKFDDLERRLDAGGHMAMLEASGDGSLPVKTTNVAAFESSVWPLAPSETAQIVLAGYGQVPVAPSAPAVTQTHVPNTARNTRHVEKVDLRQALPEGQRTGLVLARVWLPSVPSEAQQTQNVITQITDLAVHSKIGATSGIAWVTSLASGKPVEGAQVTMRDKTGALIGDWQGITDKDGLVQLPQLPAALVNKMDGPWDVPGVVVFASLENDTGFASNTTSESLSPWAFGMDASWASAKPEALGLVFTERGIYRPGDEVFLRGIARGTKLGKLFTPPAGTTVELSIQMMSGEDVLKQKLKTTAFGGFSTKFVLPADGALGAVWVEAKVGSLEGSYTTSFRIEEYRAPQFQVDLSMPKSAVVAGDAIEATVSGRYLHGGAMAGANVSWSSMRQTPEDFAPKSGAGFSFGSNVWAMNDEAPVNQRNLFASGNGVLNTQGSMTLELGDTAVSDGRAWKYMVEATVADVNRQRVTSRTEYIVNPADWYAGVRTAGDGFGEVGKPMTIEALAVGVDGERKAGAPIELVISRRDWKSIRQKGFGGHWTTSSEAVDTEVHRCSVTSETTPVTCAFTPKEPGFHIVLATTTDKKDRKQKTTMGLYVTGGGWVSWQRNDTDRIDVVADKPLYDVGDKAKILVKSPWPNAEAVVTLEREGVRWAKRVLLKGPAESIEIPIDEEMVPNAFVGVVLFRGRVPVEGEATDSRDSDPGRPAVGYGYVKLDVEKRVKRLTVDVTPEKDEMRPGETVTLTVAVKDSAGKGKKAEVTVWMVDEGVLRLTDYQKPDPIASLFPEKGLSTRIGEPLLSLVGRVDYSDKGESDGGGGGDEEGGLGFRSKFKTTAYFNPAVLTDSNGRATVKVELPDNLTTYRLMAVAVTEGDQGGSGESKLTVTKPLLAQPALPRMARSGDTFEAGVVVHARGQTFDDVEVTASAEGLKIDGPTTLKVNLANGRPQEVRFHFVAGNPGTAKLRFSVKGGGEQDGVEQLLPIQLPVGMEAVATYGDTESKKTEAVVTPNGVRPDAGGLTLTLSSSVLGGYDEAMRQLVEYPYGCSEQLSSRLVPFIALRELHGKFQDAGAMKVANSRIAEIIGDDALATQGSTDPDEVVKRTVATLSSMQNPDGGFRYWSNSRCASGWTSAYSTLALSRASEVGYAVPKDVVAKGQKYLADTIAAGRCVDCGYGCNKPDDVTRTFALYVLARTGQPKSSYYGELFAKRDALPLFGKALLADAMYVGQGDRAQAKQLMAEIINHAKESPAEVHFEEPNPSRWASVFSSDVRTTAIVLQTLTTITPDHPFVPKMARYLGGARQKNGQYRSTQESAFSLMALAEVMRTKEAATPDFQATVTLGNDTLAQADFKGRSLEVKRVEVPISSLANAGKQTSLVFEKKGTGSLTYGALLRYAPVELPITPLDQGLVVQRWFEPFAGGGQARKFTAGDLVRVTVRVSSHMERRYLALTVPLPAGLEAVDTSLASSESLQQPSDGEEESERYEFYSPFNHSEMRDDRVTFFADMLPPGIHVASFVARATTPGDFVLVPASAEEMYAPEVFGRSDGGRFVVAIPKQVSER